MSDVVSIVSFENVTVDGPPAYETGVRDVSFQVDPGALVLVNIGEHYSHVPLADAAEGLVLPSLGRVHFLGRDWSQLSPAEAAACRGTIGRVFESHGWISNLDMDENITLPLYHHTKRPMEEVIRDAEQLARELGFAELPRLRPAKMKRADLRRAEWVRAFLGDPHLVILENPMADVYADALGLLTGAIEKVRQRGAAVLWITTDFELQNFKDVNPSKVYALRGQEIKET